MTYKTKDKKVQSINKANRIDNIPRGQRDQYKRSKLRGTPQEQFGKYQEYIIPRFSNIPRRLYLTPKRLKELNIRDTLQPIKREFLEEVLITREKVFTFK